MTNLVKSVRVAREPNFNELNFTSDLINSKEPVVDIICPVYKGYNETLSCIYSVLKAKTKIPYRLIIINDCSPDIKLTKRLRELKHKFFYYENKKNLGFLKSMNYGMSLSTKRDVIWLNSDTEVNDYWIDRLRAIVLLDTRIATVTPISNSATIASYPYFCKSNNDNLELTDYELDKICSNLFTNMFIETPTGIGFCMYVKRKALQKVGQLDEVFDKGYGEENDLCQRFHKIGMINVITPSIFVRHYGSISFGEFSSYYSSKNSIILNKKHPRYFRDIKKWVKEDPLKFYRTKIDLYRLLNYNKCNKNKQICLIPKDCSDFPQNFLDYNIKIILYDCEFDIVCNMVPNTPNLRKLNSIGIEECIQNIGATQVFICCLNRFSRRQLIKLTSLLKLDVEVILVLDEESKEFVKNIQYNTSSPWGRIFTLIKKAIGFSSRLDLCNMIISRAQTQHIEF